MSAQRSAHRSASTAEYLLAAGVPTLLLAWLAVLQLGQLNQPWMLWLHRHLLPAFTTGFAPPSALTGLHADAWSVAAVAWSCLTVLGLGLSACLLLLSASVARPQRLAAFVFCLLIAGSVTHLFKRALDAPRPAVVIDSASLQVIGMPLHYHSMPSGHSTTAFAWAALMIFLPRRAALPPAGTVAVLAAAAAVGLSRIAVGAHWPADVLAGASLGWTAALLSIWLARRSGLVSACASVWGWRAMTLVRVAGGLVLCLMDTGYPLGLPVQWGLGLYSIAAGLLEWRRGFVSTPEQAP